MLGGKLKKSGSDMAAQVCYKSIVSDWLVAGIKAGTNHNHQVDLTYVDGSNLGGKKSI